MLKMIIVDDEAETCDFVRNFFEERDFEVYTAYSGEEALNIAELQDPHIILLDIKMPVMDGMQVLKELHRRRKTGKVIVVTAVDDSGKAEEAKRYGAVDYITKPLSLEQLEGTVLGLANKISTMPS